MLSKLIYVSRKIGQNGVNYYTKEQAVDILQRIKKDKPKDYEILAEWLEKAVSEYNGFYFLGV